MKKSPVRVFITVLGFIACLAVSGCGTQQEVREPGAAEPAAPSPQWRVLGPGGGGSQFLPTINPDDPNHVFVRCDMTGAYVTYDGGESWRMFNLRTVVLDFEFDPSETNTVYAANSGLYRSDDRGARWRLIYPDPGNIVAERMVGDHANQRFETKDGLPGGQIAKVRVDPANSSNLYIGVTPKWEFSPDRPPRRLGKSVRIMVSEDRGTSWRKLAEVRGEEVLAIFPGTWSGKEDVITVFTNRAAARISKESGKVDKLPLPVKTIQMAEGGQGEGKSVFYVLSGMEKAGGRKVSGGLYRSDDGGRSWKQVNSGLLDHYPETKQLPRFRTFAVCEGDPKVAYLSCMTCMVPGEKEPRRHFGIYKTGDGGESWNWVYRADFDSLIIKNHEGGWMLEDYGPEWGEYPHSIGINPTDSDLCYATDFGCTYRTTDGGALWKQVYTKRLPDRSWISRGLDVTTCYGVHFDPHDHSHIFISYTDIGAFHSFNGGRSWLHSIDGINRQWQNTCYWMVFDPQVKNRAWSVWGSGHDLPRPKMFRGGNFDRYVGGAAFSDDGCRSWWTRSQGMPENTVCTHIVLDPTSPVDSRTLYVCGFGHGVFKSTDSGNHWKNMSSGVGPNLNAWRITRTPDGTLYLLVARGLEKGKTVGGALYRSDDGAGKWRKMVLPEGVNAPNDLVYDPSNPKRMYLSCWPWPEGGREHCGGLLRTEDGGVSWKRVFDEEAHVYAAAVDPSNPFTVFINTFNSAAFRSDDRGETWSRLKGYNFKWGHRPVVDPYHNGMLYLTTFGGSVFYGPAVGAPDALEDIENDTFLRW